MTSKKGSALLGVLVIAVCWAIIFFIWLGGFDWILNLFISSSDLEGY